MKENNLSISLFGIPTKAVFLFFTTLTLLLYSACSGGGGNDVPPEPPPQTYTVTFNTNGGSEVQSREVNSGNTVARPENPTKADSVFANWFTDEALTNIYNFSTPVTSDLTLYAKWISEDATTYELVFNTNGGSNVEPQTIVEGQTADEPDDPSRDGYKFLNWYSDPDAPSTAYDFGTAVRANMTIYANWLRVYTIAFNTNGGSVVTRAGGNGGDEIASQFIDSNSDTKVSAPSQVLSRDGYRFLNWYSDPKAPSTAYEFTETAVTDDITIYANWLRVYTVRFNMNGGVIALSDESESNEIATQFIDSNSDTKVSKPSEIPTRAVDSFLNWYSDPEAPEDAYDFDAAVTDDITIYANWLKRFTVTFNTNGGSEEAQQIIDSGMVVDKPTENPTNEKHGGTFEGWYSNEELTTESEYDDDDFNAPVIQNLSLYVKWSYMVTYDETTRSITGLNPNLSAGNVDLVIPSNFNGMKVDNIMDAAFLGNGRIASLRIAEGIKRIGGGAFRNCTGLTGSLTIPDSVVSIGDDAFRECTSFNGSLTIGKSVVIIGNTAFQGCSSFTGDLTIPNSVVTIQGGAFLGCSGFNGRLTIGNSVVTIGNVVFSGCTGFDGSVTIPSSVKTIESSTFLGMNGMDTFIFESNTPPKMPFAFGPLSFFIFGDPSFNVIIVPDENAVTLYRQMFAGGTTLVNRIRAAQ